MSNYYKSNTSPTGRILNPKGFIGLSEFQDADVEGKRKLANEYLADLRNAFLNSDEFADKNEALSSWKEDAKYVWDNVDSGWGERAVDAGKGLVRSVAYGTMAVPAAVAHGAVSLGSRITTFVGGGDEVDQRFNQRQIDDALPSGAIFNEKISQIGTRIGDAFKTDNSRHDDFDVFMNASERYAIDKTEENLRLLNDAERKLLQSSADFNREDVKNYAHRSISQNNDVKNLLSLYLATNDPELRSEIKKHYILSLSDEGSQNRIERQKKRQLDYWGEDSVVGNEMATRLEYANPLDMAGTALGVGLAWKGAKAVVGGAKAAKTASFASRLGKGTKEFAKGVIAEAGTEIADTLVENPAATDEQLYKAGRAAFDQEALTFGIGTGVRAVQNRNRKEIQEQVDEIGALGDIRGDGATSGAETASTETTTGGESGTLTGSTTSTIGGKTTVETHTSAGDIVGAMEAPTAPEGTTEPTTETTPIESVPVETETDVAPVETTPTETAPVESGFESAPVIEIPLEKLQLSKDVPNFKEGADAKTGVVKGEELEGKYERTGTAPIVVFERLNGDLEVITGRHRLDLAKRSGEKTIPSQIVREADGFTVEDAKTFDAESNIRDEKGTVKDYAHYFRNKDISQADAESRGLIARKKGQQGWAIGKQASDELYGLYRNGKISDDRAAAIARGAPNDADVQRAALASSQGMDALTLEIHTRRLAAYKAENSSDVSDGGGIQGDLFGEDDSAMQEIVAVSKAAGELVKENKQKIAAVSGAVKRPEIAREMGVDINNPEQVKAAIQALEYENSRLMSPTPEIEILNKIRRRAGLSEIVDNSATDSEVSVHHDDDTASLDLGFNARKDGVVDNKDETSSASVVDSQKEIEQKATESYNVIRKLADAVFAKTKAIKSRLVSASNSILPRGIKLDKTTNRLVGMCSIADIRRYISNAFEIPIARGIRESKSFLGIYYNKLEAIRLKAGHLNDIGTIAHELGHHLEMILFGGKLKGSGTAVEAELAGYGKEKFGDAYGKDELAQEGFAELISDILAGNMEKAQKRCPIAFEMLKQALSENPTISKVFNNIRQMVLINKDANAWARMNANMRRRSDDVERSTLMKKFGQFLDWFERSMFDNLIGMQKIADEMDEQCAGSGKKFMDLARNFRGGHMGRTISTIKVAQCDLDGNIVGKSLVDICKDNLKEQSDRENINAYLAARRCVEYYKANPKAKTITAREKFGFSYADAIAICNEASSGMKLCAKELDVYLQNNLKLLLDSGVISKETYKKLSKMKGYVPMQRYMEAINESVGVRSKEGFANQNSPLKSFIGSDREFIAPLDSIVKQTYAFREIAEKNRIARLLVQGIDKGVALGNWASHAPDKVNVEKLRLKEWAESILIYKESIGEVEKTTGYVRECAINEIVAELETDPSISMQLYREKAMADEKNQVITVMTNGRASAWQIHDKSLYVALTSMDIKTAQVWKTTFGKAVHWFSRLLRVTATGALSFTFSNFVRDTVTGYILTRNGYKPFDGLIHGLFPAIAGRFGKGSQEHKDLYNEWQRAGGSFASSAEGGGQYAEEADADLVMGRSKYYGKSRGGKVWQFGKSVIEFMENISGVAEESIRLAEYYRAKQKGIKQLKSKGMSEAEAKAVWESPEGASMRQSAANDSKEVTMNFSKAGTVGQQMNMAVTFFNAGMQGLYKFKTDFCPKNVPALLKGLITLNADLLKKSANHDNNIRFVKLIAVVALGKALQEMFDGDDGDQEDWMKRQNWLLRFGTGENDFIRIPKAHDVIAIEVLWTALQGEFTKAGKDALDSMVPNIFPQAFKPILEWMTNYSFFTGRNIESPALKNILPTSRIGPTTSKAAIWVSEMLSKIGMDISPIMIDHLGYSYFSGLGSEVTWLLGKIVSAGRKTLQLGDDNEMESSWREAPIVKRFVVNEFSPSVYVGKFYDMANEFEQIYNTAKRVEDGRLPLLELSAKQIRMLEWYMGDYEGESRKWHLGQVKRFISDRKKEMRIIQNHPTMTGEEKRRAMLTLNKMINDVCKRAYTVLKYE